MKRTVCLKVAHALHADHRRRFGLEMHWSDGLIQPIGNLYESVDDLLDAMIDIDGDTHGAEHCIIERLSIPTSGTCYVN